VPELAVLTPHPPILRAEGVTWVLDAVPSVRRFLALIASRIKPLAWRPRNCLAGDALTLNSSMSAGLHVACRLSSCRSIADGQAIFQRIRSAPAISFAERNLRS
jgi:hypothetical protein